MNLLKSNLSAAFAASCLVLGVSSCGTSGASSGNPGDLGKSYARVIPGTWTETRSRGAATMRLEKTFEADGTARGALDGTVRKGGVSLVMPRTPFHSKWRVSGDVVDCYDIVTADPELFPKGTVIHDRLIAVTADRVEYRDMETGEKGIMLRKR